MPDTANPASAGRFLLEACHDARHVLSDSAHARESLVFMLQIPEAEVACFVYTWVSGHGKAGSAFVVYGPGVGETVADFCDGVDVPVTAGFDDWQVGRVLVRHGEPWRSASVTVAAGGRASLRYDFEAVHPPYAYGQHRDGCPGWVAENRIEQSGRVRGVLSIDGREIPFDTMGHRDHSWGTRDWFFSQHWKWLEAQAGAERVVHFWEVEALGRKVLRGYVVKDGEMAEVTRVDIRFEHDQQLVHRRISATVLDDLGRETQVEGATFAWYPFAVSPLVTLHEASMAVSIDGRRGVGHVEMAWPKAYLEHVTAHDLTEGSPVLRGLP